MSNKISIRASLITILSLSAFLFTPCFVQSAGATTVRTVDLNTPLSQDIQTALAEWCPDYRMSDWEVITRDVQLTSQDYNLSTSLILSLMAGEKTYGRIAQARLYYFNLDLGTMSAGQTPPDTWFDSQRVARAYAAQYERYEDKTAAVAAYYLGYSALPPDGSIRTQPQSFIDLVSMVLRLDAEWSHLGERTGPQIVDGTETSMDQGGAQVVEVTTDTPPTAFESVSYDMTEIENAYIQNMMYFNSRLDETIAHEIFDAIATHAQEHQTVDARLVMALVACESSFRPDAVSHAGALGLGQLMPFTAERFGVQDPFDVDENIGATFSYLEREFNRWTDYNYTLDRVLAAYNAGAGAVEEYSDAPHNGIPPYEETINYVRRVVNIYYYLLPEGERARFLSGQSRHITEANGFIYLAS